ncbi:MAG: 5-(carboxyamino)imidazole ribonucleotide mutase [Gammaproteobacteria bacterium]
MNKPFVAILMGSESDLPVMQGADDVLNSLGVRCEMKITSAHRTPAATKEYLADAESRGCQVFIAGAGLAAHLAGAVAAHTLKPVIGVPIDSGPMQGMDSLLSTVQMPAGIPVGTVAIGKTGAKNAGYLAAQILGLADPELAARVKAERQQKSDNVQAQDRALQESRKS